MLKKLRSRLTPLCKLSLVSIAFVGGVAYSFPANSRLGYANCASCHVSPTGGGALNDYGRSTANEISTWNPYPEGNEDSGASNFIIGADARYLWTKFESPTFQYETKFLMQTDFELGATYKGLTVAGQFGQYYSEPQDVQASYRHYVMYTYRKHSVRVGKFAPVFGLNEPDHTLPGRNALGFDNRKASYNVEYVYASRRWAVNLTGVGGCQGGFLPDSATDYCDDAGFVGYTAQGIWSPNKIVTAHVSQAYLTRAVVDTAAGQEPEDRLLFGLSWVIGTKKYYTLGELDMENNSLKQDTVFQGYADFMVSPVKGTAIGYTLKLYEPNRKKYGVKASWLPVAGLEFNFAWMREFNAEANSDQFVLLAHAYL